MKKLCRFEVFILPSQHPARPMPAGRPVGSGAWPASCPAQAGCQAGWLGGLAGSLPGPGRSPGRLAQPTARPAHRLAPARPQRAWPIAASPRLLASERALAPARSREALALPLLARSPAPLAAPVLRAGCAGLAGRPGMQAGPCRLPGRLSQPSTPFLLQRLFFLLDYLRVFSVPVFYTPLEQVFPLSLTLSSRH